MHMSFWWGCDFGDFFFKGATVQTVYSMILLCVIFTAIAIAYEGLKGLETKMHRENDIFLKQSSLGPCSDDRNTLIQNKFRTKAQRVLLYTTNSSINYLVMLAIMLYNGFVFLAVIIGIAIGYFIFGLISDHYNRKAIFERQKVGVVCEPECVDNGNRSTPPLLEREEAGNEFTCEVQIESPCRKIKADNDDYVLNDDNADEIKASENLIRKTADLSKIKGRKSDCCAKTDNEIVCCDPQPGVTSTTSSDELIQRENTFDSLEANICCKDSKD